MKPYGNQLNLKKKVSYESKKNSQKISIINIKFLNFKNIMNEIIIDSFCFG